jgi:sugar phosphate isomerase/epimerase
LKNIKNSHLAGMNLHYLNYSLEYFLNSMAKNEIPNIELWGGFPHLYSEDVTLGQAVQLRKEIESRGLNLVCYTPEQLMYANNIAAKEPDIHLLHIHVIDGTPSGHLAVGDGTLPIDKYLKEIDEFNYQGYLSLELAASSYYPDPDKSLIRSIENIRKML